MKKIITAVLLFFSICLIAEEPIEFNEFTIYPIGEAAASQMNESHVQLSGLNSESDGVQVEMDHSHSKSIDISPTSPSQAGDALNFFSLGDLSGAGGVIIGSTHLAYDGETWTISGQGDLSSSDIAVMILNGDDLVAEVTGSEAIQITTQGTLKSVGMGPVAPAIGPGGGGPCPWGSSRYYQCQTVYVPGAPRSPCRRFAGFSLTSALQNCCNQNNGGIVSTCSGPVGVSCRLTNAVDIIISGDRVVGDSVVVVIKNNDQLAETFQSAIITTSGIGNLDLKSP